MGRVYRGFDPLVRRVVAIKMIKSEYLTRDTRDEYLRRFRREAQAAGSLSHSSIVSIFDVAEDYIVMEFVEGVTLSDLIKHRGALDLPEALAILAPVGESIDYAHKAGVVHRDIKPANIMVQPDGRPKLMDFGVARLESTAMTAAGHFFGSPSYMSPEQILSAEVTSRADLFSFAVVAYEAITGKRPFQGDSVTSIIYKVVNAPAAPPSSWNLDLPPYYDEVFRRALAKDPAGRFASAGAFVAALQGQEVEFPLAAALLPDTASEAAASVPMQEVETQALTPEDTGRGFTRRHRSWLIGGVAVLAVAAEVVYLQQAPVPAAPPPASASSERPAAEAVLREALRIETEPEGAVVFVDGVKRGRAPLSLADLSPGAHQVRIAERGYAPAELRFELAAGTVPPPLRFKMAPLSIPISIRSVPEGARVRLDGKPVGVTPLRRQVDPGRHDVRVEHEGFLTETRRMQARIGEPLELRALLKPAPADESLPAELPRRTLTIQSPVLEGDLVDLGPNVLRPRRLSGDAPPYPEAARRLRLGGTVKVEFTITEGGQADNFRILESAGAVLDETVIETLQRWRFEPARKDGVRVRVRERYQQTFVDPDA